MHWPCAPPKSLLQAHPLPSWQAPPLLPRPQCRCHRLLLSFPFQTCSERREALPRTALSICRVLCSFARDQLSVAAVTLSPFEGLWQGHLPSPSWRGRCWRVHCFLSGQWEECTVHSFVRSFVCSFILQRCPLGPQCDLGPFLGMECSRMNLTSACLPLMSSDACRETRPPLLSGPSSLRLGSRKSEA